MRPVVIESPYAGDIERNLRYLHEKEIRRAVTCLVACAGIPTEALEAGHLAQALKDTVSLLAMGQEAGSVPAALTVAAQERAKEVGDSLVAALRALGRLP